ncbi:MAG: lysophospholipid acyltransferase family protein [Spirochaetota bacterium]
MTKAKQTLVSHPGKKSFAEKIVDFIGRHLYRLFFQVEIRYPKRLPKKGPVLILAKHCSNHDVPLGLPAIKRMFRRKDVWAIMKDSLANPWFLGIFLKAGGIPINRENPTLSKTQLLFAREVLYQDQIMIIFPEQTRIPEAMGEGKSAGFRFIAGKPQEPLAVNCIGYEYKKGRWRDKVTIRCGKTKYFHRGDNAEQFLHKRMLEIAWLSNLQYPFAEPKKRKTKTS